MKIKEIMTTEVEFVQTNDTFQTAARKMRDRDVGFLPVFEGDQLIGVLTDRDLALRVLADGTGANTILGRNLITSPVIYCFDDQDVEDALRLMRINQIRRLAILGRNKNRLVGVVSLGDLAGTVDGKQFDTLLQSVSSPIKLPQ
jgi:CBS domain-containing protein